MSDLVAKLRRRVGGTGGRGRGEEDGEGGVRKEEKKMTEEEGEEEEEEEKEGALHFCVKAAMSKHTEHVLQRVMYRTSVRLPPHAKL